ncbi:MAG: hypothetical protein ACHQCF_00015 [Solirubrobacterales bacterium]
MAEGEGTDALEKFAEQHGLAYAAIAELPQQGSTLAGNGRGDGAATGKLDGDLEGTLAHYSYVYTWTDADHHSHSETRHFTIVVTQIAESIAFVPHLGFAGPSSHFSPFAGSNETSPVDLGEDKALDGCNSGAYKGTSKSWIAQLFSPSLLDWLSRSDEDFGFELANGVLCVGRSSRLDDAQGLEGIWNDGGHFAAAIRKEAFYSAYAADRNLTLEPPLHFAATHAEAKVPFRPDRAFTGALPGGLEGSLVLCGDGSKRSDRIAMVAGPKGPFAEDELDAEAAGITAKPLDGYAERLEEKVTAPRAKA